MKELATPDRCTRERPALVSFLGVLALSCGGEAREAEVVTIATEPMDLTVRAKGPASFAEGQAAQRRFWESVLADATREEIWAYGVRVFDWKEGDLPKDASREKVLGWFWEDLRIHEWGHGLGYTEE